MPAFWLTCWLRTTFLPSGSRTMPPGRFVRRVSEHRGLVVQRSQFRNRIHAILNRNLVECPYTDAFGRAGRQWLTALPLPGPERSEVNRLLRLMAALEREIAQLEMELAQARLQDAGLRHLITVPGIGLIT